MTNLKPDLPARHAALPPRRLPLLYLAFAHLCLVLAASVVAVDPAAVTGFFYHPLMIGIVHLVTLGWISASILGFVFIVGPLALRLRLPAGRADRWVFGCYAVGVTGMVSHFWIREYSGMAWSAGMVVVAVAHVAGRVGRELLRAPIPTPVRLSIGAAGLNLVAAGVLGVLIGADREVDVVPGFTLTNVYAHAHLAGLGWATLMVIGLGHRLLPMVLPAAMPPVGRTLLSFALLQLGVVLVAGSLLLGHRVWSGGVLLAAAGVAVFLWTVRWMRRHPRPAPPARPQPDWGRRHVGQALGYLALTTLAGLALTVDDAARWSTQIATFYGVTALVGFLSQMVVGMESRLLPLFQWYTRFGDSGLRMRPTSPHDMGSQRIRAAVFWLWTAAVPLLAFGMAFERVVLVGWGGWLLLAASGAHSFNTLLTLVERRERT